RILRLRSDHPRGRASLEAERDHRNHNKRHPLGIRPPQYLVGCDMAHKLVFAGRHRHPSAAPDHNQDYDPTTKIHAMLALRGCWPVHDKTRSLHQFPSMSWHSFASPGHSSFLDLWNGIQHTSCSSAVQCLSNASHHQAQVVPTHLVVLSKT